MRLCSLHLHLVGSLWLLFKAHADPQEKTCSEAVPSCLLSPRHVFFMDSCHLDVKDGRLGSTALCVASCPEEQLHTLEEVQLFANNTGGCRGAPRAGPAPGGPRWGHLCTPAGDNLP